MAALEAKAERKVVRSQPSNGKDKGGSVWESNPPSGF
jgi:hypothetical protein